jgi:metallo-beta-lactamase class B
MKRTLIAASLIAAFAAPSFGQGRQGAPPSNETLSESFRVSHGRDVAYQLTLPGFKIFDNLYHVGVGTVSTWLIPTTAGLIMIDSSQEPYVEHVLDNIRNLGFDPKDVKYVLIVHGHLDHFGGAARIKQLSGARIGLTEADWKMVDAVAEQQRQNPPRVAPVNHIIQRDARDLVLKDGDVITLGKTSIKVYVTPGHTPGSASFEFTVYDNGKPHKAFMFGGPEPRDGVEGGKKFLASVNRVTQMEPDVEVGLLIHSYLALSTYPNGGTFERMVRLQSRRPGEPNPFVDPQAWQQWLVKLKQVADKWIADETAKAGQTASAQPARPAGQAARPPVFPTKEQFEASAEAQRRVAAAKELAGTDLILEFENTCSFTGPERAALKRQRLGLPPLKDYTVEPTKIFDNVWFLGLASQGAFVITTNQGLILIDTLNSTEEARDILVPSMQKVGLDPAQIKYIVLSHGHPGQTDHTGGANYLQKTYHPRILMGKEDWDATLPAQKPERPLAIRDVDVKHGDTLTLGDETLTFTNLFGHTPGTLGIFIPVKWHGESHVVLLHGGGLQHPNRDSLNRLEAVIRDYALKMGADGILNAHPGIYQDTLADMETIRKNPNGANPLLYGKDRAQRYWKIMDECATARVVALEQAAGTN